VKHLRWPQWQRVPNEISAHYGGGMMATTKPIMKMPELLIFVRVFAIGFVLAEIWRVAFYIGTSFAQTLSLTWRPG
jgi:hypothetical protein